MTGARIGREALYARVRATRRRPLGVALSPGEGSGLAVRGDMGKGDSPPRSGGLRAPWRTSARPGHRHAPQAQQASPEGARALRGVRLRPHTRTRHSRCAAGAVESTRRRRISIHPDREGIGRRTSPRRTGESAALPATRTYYLKATELRDKL